jgi:hypothetical protein
MKLQEKIAREISDVFECSILEGVSSFDDEMPQYNHSQAEHTRERLLELSERIIKMVEKKRK